MEKSLSLKEYQQGAYRTEKAELAEVLSLIKKVIPLYDNVFLERYWPYKAQNNEKLHHYKKGKYSISTNAMIMAMLISVREKIGLSSEKDSIEKNIDAAKDEYFSNVLSKDTFASSSESYGNNDPLNLFWAHILFKGSKKDRFISSINDCIKNKVYKNNKPVSLCKLLKLNNGSSIQAHSFIALYAYRCAILAGIEDEIKEVYFDFFELRLHQNLSFKSIPDSRFDPAELVFCLEGMLLSKKSSVSDEILHRVFEVLGEAQDTTPCWRPVNPIYASPQGQIFLPLSIEVGMSLLNIFEKIDSDSKPQSYFAKYLPMLQRYFRWLKAQEKAVCFLKEDRKRKGFFEPCDVYGWESEHVGDEGVIHIWQTALILDYLASYAKLLKRHIAKQYLISSNLSVQYNESPLNNEVCFFVDSNPFPEYLPYAKFEYNIPSYFFKNFISSRKTEYVKARNCRLGCCCSKDGHCPTLSLCSGSSSSDSEKEKFFSLLLYGPPGTGKSYFTKMVAKCLMWKHITVTPSDFLADGSAEIEARAKGIFACLMEQENAVILFDEIDQFILDRDSIRYDKQTDVFKLLTPGMLPKFQDLRDNAKCIFIIATNYAERIDPAVVRAGRVDKKIPLMPPSWEKRVQLCKEKLSKDKIGERFDLYCEKIANLTAFYTWKELNNFLELLPSDISFEDLPSFISNNGSVNLSFKKILQRIPFWDDNDKFDATRHDTKSVVEELTLLSMAYGKNCMSGLLHMPDSIAPKLSEAVKRKIREVKEQMDN